MIAFCPGLKGIALVMVLISAAFPGEPVPENVVVSLRSESPEFLIGENALVHFKVAVRNGTASFDFGGDYQGCPRALRFQVTAQGPDGKMVSDPYPQASVFCMGGLGGTATITEEQPWEASISLPRYLLIDQPGDYLVTISHDGGWNATPERPIPAAKITVRFRLPTPEETKARVESWLGTPSYTGTYGKASLPHPDWEVIRHPIWMEALTAAARKGCRQAIAGIDSVRTVESTGTLISLLPVEFTDSNARVDHSISARAEILQALAGRVAPRVLPLGQPTLPAPVLHTPEQAVLLCNEVRKLVTGDDPTIRAEGARILGALGSKVDLSILLSVLDLAAQHEQNGVSRRDLMDTLDAYARLAGADAPPGPTSTASTLVWLDALRRRPRELTKDDQARLAACFGHALSTVRQAAIEAVAKPWPKIWVPELRRLLEDGSSRVRWYACTRAGETGAKELIPGLVRLLSDQQCDSFAATGIEAIGGRLAAIRAWLDVGERGWHGAWWLISQANYRGDWPKESGAHVYIPRLRAFVEAHAAELEKGTIQPDQTWPTDLLPETMWLQLPQGTWPEGRGPKIGN